MTDLDLHPSGGPRASTPGGQFQTHHKHPPLHNGTLYDTLIRQIQRASELVVFCFIYFEDTLLVVLQFQKMYILLVIF